MSKLTARYGHALFMRATQEPEKMAAIKNFQGSLRQMVVDATELVTTPDHVELFGDFDQFGLDENAEVVSFELEIPFEYKTLNNHFHLRSRMAAFLGRGFMKNKIGGFVPQFQLTLVLDGRPSGQVYQLTGDGIVVPLYEPWLAPEIEEHEMLVAALVGTAA